MSYRKIYESVFGKIPKNYVIHHIDFNKNNNTLENLSCIPKEIHIEYHQLVNWAKREHTLVEHALCICNNSQVLIANLKRLDDIKKIIRIGNGC
jgi:hypothetical protein